VASKKVKRLLGGIFLDKIWKLLHAFFLPRRLKKSKMHFWALRSISICLKTSIIEKGEFQRIFAQQAILEGLCKEEKTSSYFGWIKKDRIPITIKELSRLALSPMIRTPASGKLW